MRRPTRPRALLMVLALALVPLATSASVRAQDSPEAAVHAVFDAIAAKEFDRIGELVCEEEREAVVAQFDLAAAFESIPGVDATALLDALTFSVEDRSVSLVSQEDASAVVAVSARLSGRIDEDAARDFVRQVLEAGGQEATDELVESLLPTVVEEIEQGSDLDSEVEVVLEDGAWLVCDDLSVDEEEPFIEDEAFEAEGSLCGLLSLEDVNALGPVQFTTAEAFTSDSCDYTDSEAGFPSLSVNVTSDASLEDVRLAYEEVTELIELSAAGRDALTDGDQLFVEMGEDVLVVYPSIAEAPGSESVDAIEYAIDVAELLVPRILER
jgi:hypothetical protein